MNSKTRFFAALAAAFLAGLALAFLAPIAANALAPNLFPSTPPELTATTPSLPASLASLFPPSTARPVSVTPVFSPRAEPAVLAFLDAARDTLDVSLYQFSSSDAREALVNAAKRGVRVRIVLDDTIKANYDAAAFLKARGVAVRWAPPEYPAFHAKYAVADGRRVLVGSINWSYRAFNANREAAVIVDGEAVARAFANVFEDDWRKGLVAK